MDRQLLVDDRGVRPTFPGGAAQPWVTVAKPPWLGVKAGQTLSRCRPVDSTPFDGQGWIDGRPSGREKVGKRVKGWQGYHRNEKAWLYNIGW